MKEKGNYLMSSLSEFQRYTRGEMTKKEENAFQKKLQNDPFTEEVMEGFSGISPLETDDAFVPSSIQLKKQTNSGKKIASYATAASAAGLVIFASVYIILDRNKPATQPSGNIAKSVPLEVTDSTQITEFLLAESKYIPDIPKIEPGQGFTNDIIDTATIAAIENPAIAESTVTPVISVVKDSNLYITENQVPAPADTLNEVVFAKYESVKKAENLQTGYISPHPLVGTGNYNNYIVKNMIRPWAQPQGGEVVAVINFVVRTTGTIDSIRVISSSDDEFAKEAIRLIREGPAWKPAEDKGQIIDDEVRIRISLK